MTISAGDAEPTDRDKLVVNWLFDQLSAIFPAWRSAYDGDDGVRAAKRQWLYALVDAGVTSREQIDHGLRKARRHGKPFLPSTGEFIAWCRPDADELGMPTLHQVWAEIAAEHGQYSHGAVLAMRRDPRCNWWDWRLMPAQQAERRFEPIYRDYLRRVQAGEQFDLPEMVEDASEHLPSWEARKAYAQIHITAMREALGQ